jgi:lipoprotein-anchoring transpeptidase ErfK/SrfK
MIKFKKKHIILLFIFFFLPLAVAVYFSLNYFRKSKKLKKVIVDKPSLTMRLINYYGDTIYKFPVAVGTNYGNKEKVGDLKTPEGTFPVEGLEDSKDWKYDFENDGKGPIAGAYGPWFIKLKVQNASGIGIHGTHENESIGKRVSHGCVRMKNEDLLVLVNLVSPGIEVSISPDTVKTK